MSKCNNTHEPLLPLLGSGSHPEANEFTTLSLSLSTNCGAKAADVCQKLTENSTVNWFKPQAAFSLISTVLFLGRTRQLATRETEPKLRDWMLLAEMHFWSRR